MLGPGAFVRYVPDFEREVMRKLVLHVQVPGLRVSGAVVGAAGGDAGRRIPVDQ